MYKVRIKKKCGGPTHMQDGGTTEDLTNTITSSMGPVPREEANIEVEKGESAFGDINGDSFAELMFFGGKRHTEGGTPVNVPPGTFIFSDTKKLRIKDPELLEKFFNIKNPKKKGYTPAEITKQYKDFNKHMDALKDTESDQIRIGTASEMVENITNKLGALALIQESMKGFPDGIPSFAESAVAALGIDPQEIIAATQPQQPAEGMQQIPTGQLESMPLLPEAQAGGMQMQMTALSKFLPQSENGGAIKVVIKQPLKEMPKMQGGGSNPSKSGYYDFEGKTYYFDADANKWQVESPYKPGVFVYLTPYDKRKSEIQMLNEQAVPVSDAKAYSYEKINMMKGDPRWGGGEGGGQLTPEQWEQKRQEIEATGYGSDASVIFKNPYGTSYKGQGFMKGDPNNQKFAHDNKSVIDREKYDNFMENLAQAKDEYGNVIGEEGAALLWDNYLKAYESGDSKEIEIVKGQLNNIDIPNSLNWIPWMAQDKLDDLGAILEERIEGKKQEDKEQARIDKGERTRELYKKHLILKKFELEHPTENTDVFSLKSEIRNMENNLEKFKDGQGYYALDDDEMIMQQRTHGKYNWTDENLGGKNIEAGIGNTILSMQDKYGFNFLQTAEKDDPVTLSDPNIFNLENLESMDQLNQLWKNINTVTSKDTDSTTSEIDWSADEVQWEIDDEF